MNKLLATLAAGLALSGAAAADVSADIPSVVVRYGDLNLGSRHDVISLYSRLRRAAHDVCSRLDNRVLGLREQHDLCVSDALTRGVRAVGNASLTRLHRFGGRGAVGADRAFTRFPRRLGRA